MSVHSTTSAVGLSDRDNKETLVVKEEETYDADAFEKVEAEVVNLLKEPPSLVEPPPGSSVSLLISRSIMNPLKILTEEHGTMDAFIRISVER